MPACTRGVRTWSGVMRLTGSRSSTKLPVLAGALAVAAVIVMNSWRYRHVAVDDSLIYDLAVVGVLVRIRRALPSVAFAAGYSAFFYLLQIPDYFWYYAPLMFLYFCYAGMGLTDVASLFGRGLANAETARLTQAGAALLVGVVLTGFALQNRPVLGTGPDRYESAAKWMAHNLPANSTLATDEIGTVGYYTRLTIVDILGLVNPDNARYIGERRFDVWLSEYHPDYFLVHSSAVGAPMWTMEHGVQQLMDEHKLWVAKGFPNLPGLVLYCRQGAPSCSPV